MGEAEYKRSLEEHENKLKDEELRRKEKLRWRREQLKSRRAQKAAGRKALDKRRQSRAGLSPLPEAQHIGDAEVLTLGVVKEAPSGPPKGARPPQKLNIRAPQKPQ